MAIDLTIDGVTIPRLDIVEGEKFPVGEFPVKYIQPRSIEFSVTYLSSSPLVGQMVYMYEGGELVAVSIVTGVSRDGEASCRVLSIVKDGELIDVSDAFGTQGSSGDR